MNTELLPGFIELRSSKGDTAKFDCLYDPHSRAVSWIVSEHGSKMSWDAFHNAIIEYMDLSDNEKEDGDIIEVMLHKFSGSSDMCVPKSLVEKIPKYPHELVQQTLAVCE